MSELWESISEGIVPLMISFLPALGVLTLAILVLRVIFWRRSGVPLGGDRFRRQWLSMLVWLVAIVSIVVVLPLESSLREQLLALLGLLLAATIALSSGTIAANAMAGFMMRSLGSFSLGDFIQVGEYFGRVTEQDLFHTEIQTEDRDLLTIPNTYLAAHPVKVVHEGGTVISAKVTLGYEVDHHKIEAALLEAATEAELENPFVYVLDLGDFSIEYRVAGMLHEVKNILSVRSRLRRKMLDVLHSRNIEIVSPAFMNQRQVSEPVIPERRYVAQEIEDAPTDVIFDKADRAQQIKELQIHYAELKDELATLDKDKPEGFEDKAERIKRRMKAIKRATAALEK